MTTHHVDDRAPHSQFDRMLPPRLTVRPGDTVVFETLEGGGQVQPGWTAADFARVDQSRVHALTGPVRVEGAEPGDALRVEILDLQHKGWGWTAVWPAFGLLAGEFPELYLHHCRLVGDACEFSRNIRIPFEPFCGVMGVAPAEGSLRTLAPGPHGGNLDIRHLTPGTVMWLPVLADGALFSCGDCHAAQGDGEVNGSGIEAPMSVTLRFGVEKGANLTGLRFQTPPGRRLSLADEQGYYVVTAHGPDLYANSQQVIRDMIAHLVKTYGLSREAAYCLCGAAVDLKISEIVDRPDWIVSAYLPLAIFR
ncbi:MAG: acetamidase/formamidase family protein [Lentisphaerae bacterium]|nr:acetamidase/formamidase family protein [Lentisphaerota bacterium]